MKQESFYAYFSVIITLLFGLAIAALIGRVDVYLWILIVVACIFVAFILVLYFAFLITSVKEKRKNK